MLHNINKLFSNNTMFRQKSLNLKAGQITSYNLLQHTDREIQQLPSTQCARNPTDPASHILLCCIP